jgi:membrane fusion protein (multidrug efflux system)
MSAETTGTQPTKPSEPAAPVSVSPASTEAPAAAPGQPRHSRRWLKWLIALIVLIAILIIGTPHVIESLNSVSTDDAFVNGHVTFAAPRVPGQVARVLVDDNYRVHKGDLLVQLDPEPYQVQVKIAQAAVTSAQSELVIAQAQARSITGQMRSLRFNLQHAMEDVANQVALLRSKVAALESEKATLNQAKLDYERAVPLIKAGAASQEDVDHRKRAMLVEQAKVEEALQGVNQVRVALGLPPGQLEGDDLTKTPPDLDQTFSSVRQSQYNLQQAAAQLGVFDTYDKTPKELIAHFLQRDPEGNLERIYAELLKNAPGVKLAEAKVEQSQRLLDQAKLNLSYCNVVSEIDGVVTRRNVNPGNNVVAGQSLMAVRSLTEIWIDANFKETQLGELRIGQPVDIDVDMYGSKQRFKGRITGFTMGTGSTLALLPAENATGNFVKVVQRLPVRIELTNYDPDTTPLFIGLSVTPIVRIKESPTGPDAGKVLQPPRKQEMAVQNPETQS